MMRSPPAWLAARSTAFTRMLDPRELAELHVVMAAYAIDAVLAHAGGEDITNVLRAMIPSAAEAP